jgi:hypothetical protein
MSAQFGETSQMRRLAHVVLMFEDQRVSLAALSNYITHNGHEEDILPAHYSVH